MLSPTRSSPLPLKLLRSDLHGADVTNADFSDALLDKLQQQDLCKTASGRNPVTGVDTRKSLGCGGRSRGSPSAYMTVRCGATRHLAPFCHRPSGVRCGAVAAPRH